jgi:hypothetical protein
VKKDPQMKISGSFTNAKGHYNEMIFEPIKGILLFQPSIINLASTEMTGPAECCKGAGLTLVDIS